MHAKPSRFSTLATFRKEGFLLDVAVQEYHLAPIAYALALAEIAKELCEVTRQNDPAEYRSLLASDRLNRQKRNVMGDDIESTFILITLRELLMPGQAVRIRGKPTKICRYLVTLVDQKLRNFLGIGGAAEAGREPGAERRRETITEPSYWIKELQNFRKNVNNLCQHIGSEVDELATPEETIYNLRRYTSEGKLLMSPLYEEIDRLRYQLESYKRIRAALHIRRTIEKLVHEIPVKGRYKTKSPSQKWNLLWKDICASVNKNDKNPFYKLFQEAKTLELKDIERRGKNLYADMSAEIHGYDKRDFDYEHFDSATRAITRVLRPKLEPVDEDNKDVVWKEEIKKYPFRLVIPKDTSKEPSESAEKSAEKSSEKSSGKSTGEPPAKLDPGEGSSGEWAYVLDDTFIV
jgi:hypothetical protein